MNLRFYSYHSVISLFLLSFLPSFLPFFFLSISFSTGNIYYLFNYFSVFYNQSLQQKGSKILQKVLTFLTIIINILLYLNLFLYKCIYCEQFFQLFQDFSFRCSHFKYFNMHIFDEGYPTSTTVP